MQPEQHLGEANTGQLGETKQADSQSELIPRETGNKLGGIPYGPLDLGSGGVRDLGLLRRAAREGWKVTAGMKESVPDWLNKIVGNEDLDTRARVNAAKVLMEMEKHNAEQDRHEETGGVNRLDITSGGKPLGGPNLSNLSDEELERLIAERERVLPG